MARHREDNSEIKRVRVTERNRQTVKIVDRQTDRQTDGRTDRQTDTEREDIKEEFMENEN